MPVFCILIQNCGAFCLCFAATVHIFMCFVIKSCLPLTTHTIYHHVITNKPTHCVVHRRSSASYNTYTSSRTLLSKTEGSFNPSTIGNITLALISHWYNYLIASSIQTHNGASFGWAPNGKISYMIFGMLKTNLTPTEYCIPFDQQIYPSIELSISEFCSQW